MSIWDDYFKHSVGFRTDKGWGASCPGRCNISASTTGKFSWKGYKLHLSQSEMLTSTFSWVTYWQGVWGQAVQGGLSCPPPSISKRMDNQQFLLHHLLQKYLVERDINFISVNLRCLHQMFSWITYWHGVGGKLSSAVYLAPHPEFQREWIIHKFYYSIYYRNI